MRSSHVRTTGRIVRDERKLLQWGALRAQYGRRGHTSVCLFDRRVRGSVWVVYQQRRLLRGDFLRDDRRKRVRHLRSMRQQCARRRQQLRWN